MHPFEARRDARDALQAATLRLVAEFDDVPPSTVIRYVARAREQLLVAGVREGLADRAETSAREALAAVSSPHAFA